MTLFIICVWMGGIRPAYRQTRAAGSGRTGSAFDALAWPIGFGEYIATFYFVPEKP